MKVNKRGDTESLNLNVYRNLHFYQLSYQKNAFHKYVKTRLSGLPRLGKVKLHYEIHPKSKGRLDTMNVGSVVDKFFSDALVECGVIEDDDYNNVIFNSFCFGSVNPKDPHVLITITETEPRRKNNMRILLDQNEIQQALENFVQTMGLSGVTGVELSANTNGEIIAEIVTGIQQKAVANGTSGYDNVSIIRPKRGGRPLGSKNKPKEGSDVANSGSGSNDRNGPGAAESAEEEAFDAETDNEADEEETGNNGAESTEQENQSTGKNLFGDSDSSSSDQPEGEEESAGEAPVVPARKSSIFDE